MTSSGLYDSLYEKHFGSSVGTVLEITREWPGHDRTLFPDALVVLIDPDVFAEGCHPAAMRWDVIIDSGSRGQTVEAALVELWAYLVDGGWYCFENFWEHQYGGDVASSLSHAFLDCSLGGWGKISEINGKVSELHAYNGLLMLRKAALVDNDH